jgi:hypothetical protein
MYCDIRSGVIVDMIGLIEVAEAADPAITTVEECQSRGAQLQNKALVLCDVDGICVVVQPVQARTDHQNPSLSALLRLLNSAHGLSPFW